MKSKLCCHAVLKVIILFLYIQYGERVLLWVKVIFVTLVRSLVHLLIISFFIRNLFLLIASFSNYSPCSFLCKSGIVNTRFCPALISSFALLSFSYQRRILFGLWTSYHYLLGDFTRLSAKLFCFLLNCFMPIVICEIRQLQNLFCHSLTLILSSSAIGQIRLFDYWLILCCLSFVLWPFSLTA